MGEMSEKWRKRGNRWRKMEGNARGIEEK